jgi:hypothetical protein
MTGGSFAMQYHTTTPYRGDTTAAMKRLVETFSQLGFRIEQRETHAVELTGPGMHNTRQSPLVALSRVRIETARGELSLSADYGALDRLLRFMGVFLVSLAVFLCVVFAIVFRNRPGFHLWLVVLPFVPWPFLLPLLGVVLRRRVRRALDNLIHNTAMMAG